MWRVVFDFVRHFILLCEVGIGVLPREDGAVSGILLLIVVFERDVDLR
jgi:hypothetical protein